MLNSKTAKNLMTSAELENVCARTIELDAENIEAMILLGSVYVLEMKFAESWPILERAVKAAASSGNDALHLQALTNLALAYLRGVKPKLARKTGKIMYKKYGKLQQVRQLRRCVRHFSRISQALHHLRAACATFYPLPMLTGCLLDAYWMLIGC